MGHVVFLKVFFGVAVVVPTFGDVEGAVFLDLFLSIRWIVRFEFGSER